MTKIFIVILNWNNYADTFECLKSVDKLRIGKFDLRVVVVDNGSSDDSCENIRNFQLSNSNFHLIENNQNLGYAGGNNVGMRYALESGADWVMVLNNDTEVDHDLVVQLIEAAERDGKVGVLTPKIYFARGSEFHKSKYKKSELGNVIWSAGGEMDWNNVFGKNRGVDEVDSGKYDFEEEVEFATGACVFLRATALDEVGLFDERYFAYFEDADLVMRMRRAGWKIVYVPKAKLWHKVSRSSGIGSKLNDYFIIRNRLYFGMKYATMRTKFALIRESFRIAGIGSEWQQRGARDFYLRRFGRGSWKDE